MTFGRGDHILLMRARHNLFSSDMVVAWPTRCLERTMITNPRSVFASDLHMGNRWSNFREFHAFLKSVDEPEHLYLVGDIIDGWCFRRGWHWSQDNNNLIRKMLSLAKHGCNVQYVVGNHDDFLIQYVGQEFGRLEVIREVIHTAADGRRYLVLHGDQFDLIAKAAPVLYLLGDLGYAALLRRMYWSTPCARSSGVLTGRSAHGRSAVPRRW